MSPATTTWKDPKTASIAMLVLVFLCGGIAGALATSVSAHNRMHNRPFWTDTGKAAYLERIKKDLDLTPAQTDQMEMILDDFSKYYRTVLSDGKSRILQILNPEQRKKFEQMLAQERPRP